MDRREILGAIATALAAATFAGQAGKDWGNTRATCIKACKRQVG